MKIFWFLNLAITLFTFAQNNYPIVFVHGFMEWGPGEMGNYNYWGGEKDFISSLKSQGHEVFEVSVGPVSSNWERAIECYYQIKGGQVDYGKRHSDRYNVIQKPNNDLNFTEGYAVEVRDIIVFKTAPTVNDIFFGSLTGETRGTFEITDHKIDSYTGDGSTTLFDLSQNVPNNESLLVTLNGVVQHPTTGGVTGSYEIVSGVSNKLQFTAAPALGVDIQIRHLGFAAASSGDVTGFYGRTGNVALTDADDITINTAKVGGATTFTEDLVVTGNARVTGILTVGTGSLTISDRDINAVGVVTGSNFKTGSTNVHNVGIEAAGINVLGADTPIGTGATIYDSGAAVFTGVVTATQFKGDGSELTGVSGFSTALSNDTTSLLNQIFKTSVQHNVAAGTSVTIQSDAGSGNIAFTRLDRINVATGATIRVAAGTTFIMNVLNVFS